MNKMLFFILFLLTPIVMFSKSETKIEINGSTRTAVGDLKTYETRVLVCKCDELGNVLSRHYYYVKLVFRTTASTIPYEIVYCSPLNKETAQVLGLKGTVQTRISKKEGALRRFLQEIFKNVGEVREYEMKENDRL